MKRIMAIVFIDSEKPYDSLWREGLLYINPQRNVVCLILFNIIINDIFENTGAGIQSYMLMIVQYGNGKLNRNIVSAGIAGSMRNFLVKVKKS